jgi:NhaA family Na+:H+ antiporter
MPDPYTRGGLRAPDEFRRPWLRSERPVVRRLARPVERFVRLEAGSALILLAAAIAALVWANVSSSGYESFWGENLTISVGGHELSLDLRHWVTDLLMAGFFFLIALEVKREVLFGDLSERRLAVTPVAAAIGGMVVPALVFLALNASGGEPDGWAIPIATDVAFALGVLAIIGKMAPGPLRAFLLTVAIVDDIGTIVIIAVFFSSGLSFAWLGAAALCAALVYALRRLSVRHLGPFVVLAALLWIAVHESGVHATIAGVVLGLLTPAKPFHEPGPTADVISGQLSELRDNPDRDVSEDTMQQVSRFAEEAASPLARMETAVHPWSAYMILPLFALANAGVPLSLSGVGDVFTSALGLGIVLGLVVGKPLGLVAATAIAVKLTGAKLPAGVDLAAVACLGFVAGIGFTVALFISDLALPGAAQLEQAKTAILVASALASGLGVAAFMMRRAVRE